MVVEKQKMFVMDGWMENGNGDMDDMMIISMVGGGGDDVDDDDDRIKYNGATRVTFSSVSELSVVGWCASFLAFHS